MILASPVFKAMLRPTFAEGQALQSSGNVDIPLDDDHDAFHIILDIIHCRCRKVPRSVSLKLLAKLAALVDKYSFEAVNVYSDRWIAALEHTFTESDSVELFYWLSISWVFRRSDFFGKPAR